MELGQKIKQARLASGLTQRQLCGDTVTRNMLSQIESGKARPSMETLAQFAKVLGKPLSWFLEETAVTSPNLQCMTLARQALEKGDGEAALLALEDFQQPDEIFREELSLLTFYACLEKGKAAMDRGQYAFAGAALEQALVQEGLYVTQMLRAQLYPMLEECFRQMGDFRKAYEYACKGK